MTVLASARLPYGSSPAHSGPAAPARAIQAPLGPGAAGAPLRLEVLAYAPTAFYHCMHCEFVFQQVDVGRKIHAEQDQTALPEDLHAAYVRLSDWIDDLVTRHCGRVEVQVVDAASVEGVWKALRYRVRRFPALVLGGRAHPIGDDFQKADALVAEALQTMTTPKRS